MNKIIILLLCLYIKTADAGQVQMCDIVATSYKIVATFRDLGVKEENIYEEYRSYVPDAGRENIEGVAKNVYNNLRILNPRDTYEQVFELCMSRT